MKFKGKSGITLIALVITIIVLIILAGISINLVLGQYGIVNRASSGAETYSEKQAKEKLEIELANMYVDKTTNKNYNENEYLTTKLSEKGFSVNGNIVIVDGYQFQIDRSVPKIMNSLGKGIENNEITLTATSNLVADYTKSTVKIEITYTGTLKEVNLNGESLTIPETEEGKYVIEKEVEKNGNYNVFVKDSNDGYKIVNIEVKDISEDKEISDEEDLVKLAERVNAGATYEGRTVTLTKDLDLSSVCGEDKGNWTPIGTQTNPFKGNFNGNNYTIDNLYINNTSTNYQGLFGCVQNGKIIGVVIGSNSNITGNEYVGGITGWLIDSSIQNCGNNANITALTDKIGGIVGSAVNSEIIGVYNKGNLNGGNCIGGIVGILDNSTKDNVVKYSYNTGNVTGTYYVAGISGSSGDYAKIYNCYNYGNIKCTGKTGGSAFVGGISGRLRAYGLIKYSYNLGNITGSSGSSTGGIAGTIASYNGSSNIASRASTVSDSYNLADVTSSGSKCGGICGGNETYCYVKNCYVSSTVTIKKGSTLATANVGSSSNYLGKIIGYAASNTTTYINNIDILTNMPTVYYVVNELNNGESKYWSSSNVNAPKLLWEK